MLSETSDPGREIAADIKYFNQDRAVIQYVMDNPAPDA